MSDVWLCVVERDQFPPHVTAHDSQSDALAKLRETIISDLTEGDYQRETLDRLDDSQLCRLFVDEADLHPCVERAAVPQ